MTIKSTNLNGDPGLLLIDRANLELRRGRAIELRSSSACYVVTAAEIVQQTLLERLRATGQKPRLIVTPQRAAALGLPNVDESIAVVSVADDWSAADLRTLAGSTGAIPGFSGAGDQPGAAEREAMESALRFMKSGRQLPALVWIEHDAGDDDSILSLNMDALAAEAAFISSHRLRRVSEARVPLSEAVDSQIAVFRDEYTLSEHIAVIVGDPNTDAAVPVRLHSACLTGDLLGSLLKLID